MIKSCGRLPAIAIAFATCGGCAATYSTSYPESWPRLQTAAADCKAFSGVFEEQPSGRANEGAGMNAEIRSLSVLLDRQFDPGVIFRVQHVEIAFDGRSLVANARKQNDRELRSLNVLDTWTCVKGQLHATFSDSEVSEHDLVRKNHESVVLSLTVDGDLVAEVRGRSSGLGLVVVPYSVGGSYWNRYKRSE